jgi:hypothetical protein
MSRSSDSSPLSPVWFSIYIKKEDIQISSKIANMKLSTTIQVLYTGIVYRYCIQVLHDHAKEAMLDGRTIECLSPEELNSFSCKNILLFLPSKMAAIT